MDFEMLKKYEEDLKVLYFLKREYDHAKNKSSEEEIYKSIKEKVDTMFIKYNLAKYDLNFKTSSSNYIIEEMYYDLERIEKLIKEELNKI